ICIILAFSFSTVFAECDFCSTVRCAFYPDAEEKCLKAGGQYLTRDPSENVCRCCDYCYIPECELCSRVRCAFYEDAEEKCLKSGGTFLPRDPSKDVCRCCNVCSTKDK
ncbi:hypothetical protein C0J52_10242, partial [Blattella germanica]